MKGKITALRHFVLNPYSMLLKYFVYYLLRGFSTRAYLQRNADQENLWKF